MITDTEARIINAYTADPARRAKLRTLVDTGRPLAYLIGEWYFWRDTFVVTPDCLIPRPDTERVVETALEFLPQGGIFADFCTGSGCIGLSVLRERADVRCIGVDVSEGALAVAVENARRLGLAGRFEALRADLLTDTLPDLPMLNLIAANPPYIRTDVLEGAEYPDLAAEPALALDGGPDGLVFYRRMVDAFAHRLKPGGHFVFEIGYDQGDAIRQIARARGFACEIRRDYGGNDRVAIFYRESAPNPAKGIF